MNNDRKLIAKLAKELYGGKITFEEFLMKTPDTKTDEEIYDLIYLIVHEPQRGGFMGVSSEEHDRYLEKIKKQIEKLSQ